LKGLAFDNWYGVETNKLEIVDRVDTDSENWKYATRYRATSAGFLRHLLTRMPINFSEFIFIDVGSGKGRVLLEAASFPFRRIVGIEFSSRLHEIAKKSVRKFSENARAVTNIELCCIDAVDYELPKEHTICYMYNPFGAEVLEQVMKNIETSLCSSKRRFILVYLNPTSPEVIQACPRFALVESGQYGMDRYHVYSAADEDAASYLV
jgi:16S rRNA G966 N2-methylase RsmD